ncbi:restriction endonuclease subunit S [Pedobacter sp. Hv1]|uniref:restriction endonuclease subunit S n=1 Tax=Pedobacter sp. Hv1 TaxID=1740090 RepID=UPI0006D8BB10|nr:restriction endonuclease subunit S [Pedobacter sp. Hv1]KQC02019.1 hypothetical protein AQF98_00140 [Pedobacter sp. Hv1]
MSEVINIPDGWVETTLGQVTEYINRGISPKYSETDGIYVLNQRCIRDSKVSYENARLHNIKIKSVSAEKFLQHLDVLICSTGVGTLGRVAQIKDLISPTTVDSHVSIVRGNSEIDKNYLGLLLRGKEREIEHLAEGSTGQTELPRKKLDIFSICIPKEIQEQESIANILTSFDDKIELLQSQNKTLEELAQLIFTEWFSKYKNGEKLPEGWRIEKLEEIANHSKSNIKPFDNPTTEYYHYSLPSYDNGLIPIIEKGEMIKSNKYVVESNSFLVSKLNPFTPRIWTIFDSQNNFICSTEFQVVNPKEELFFSLIHCFLNSNEFTSELSQKIKGTSSSHQRVNPQDIFDVELVIPNEKDLISFNSIIYPLISKKNINHQQIQTLSLTRDGLLPKLMRGEIIVNEFSK